ncbi:hypothetical protein DVH26_21265 [Paenibacillus sp. H1-7]|uniref:hypothetical protein n=1 Tax=Paenibacillus sp. H1-7 TaxID=2282849 RepID=UPI001EF7A0A1|nr:hypothetical protein [Paenibacillus sp. H1-7]ULL16747.1 hypothetical protein DVH26_21265 [Paenibacillus sp. H1-7]
MFDYLTHYYKKDSVPFQTLSALTRSESLKVMNEIRDESPIYSRFNKPNEYMDNRRKVEEWLKKVDRRTFDKLHKQGLFLTRDFWLTWRGQHSLEVPFLILKHKYGIMTFKRLL